MANVVECCVCGKNFAITDADAEICKKIAVDLEGEDAVVKYMCKYCEKMIKPKIKVN